MRQLQFVKPESESWEEALVSFRQRGIKRVLVIGKNGLASDTVKLAENLKMEAERADEPGPEVIRSAPAIVFTQRRGDKLSAVLPACASLEDVRVMAPVTDHHSDHKPLFIVSIPKAGTHLVYGLAKALGYEEGVDLPEFPRGKTWYCVQYTNSHTTARDFFVDSVKKAPFGNRHHPLTRSPVLFCYRHPLDILVSEANYYHRDGKTTFAGRLNQYDFSQRVRLLMNDPWMLGSPRQRIGPFLPWLEFPNVIAFSFEELVGPGGGGTKEDQVGLIWSIQLKLQVSGCPEKIAEGVFNLGSPTFHNPRAGRYTALLPDDVIRDFAENNSDLLDKLGYPTDGSPALPAWRKKRRSWPIAYSIFDHDSMPIKVESDFMGCNLVKFRGRIYAVPISAGPLDLEKLSELMLSYLPSSKSISNLKVLLSVGYVAEGRQRRYLNRLGIFLGKGEPAKPALHDDENWDSDQGPIEALEKRLDILESEHAETQQRMRLIEQEFETLRKNRLFCLAKKIGELIGGFRR